MAKVDNYMVSNFDIIRAVLHSIATYGCYTPKQVTEKFQMSEASYKENLQRVFFALSNEYVKKNKFKKANIVSLNYDRYDNIANLLIRAFKMKTGTKMNIDIILKILQELGTCANNGRTILDLDNAINHEAQGRKTNLYLYLDELIELGMVNKYTAEGESFINTPKKHLKYDDDELVLKERLHYRLSPNILENIYYSDANFLIELNRLLYMFRHIMPMSSIGHMTQETIQSFSQCNNGEELPRCDNFIFKDCFYWNMLDDEILLHILYAKEKQRGISFNYSDANGNCIIVQGFPYKVMINDVDHRQYLFLEEIEGDDNEKKTKRLNVYRLDKMEKISIHKKKKKENDPWLNGISDEYPIEYCRKAYLLKNSDDYFKKVDVYIDFYIMDDESMHQLYRLKKEKDYGELDQINDKHWVYSTPIVADQISALVPWIRSFGKCMVVRLSGEHDLRERVIDSYMEMMENYEEESK